MLHIDFIKYWARSLGGFYSFLSTFNFQCFSDKNIQNVISVNMIKAIGIVLVNWNGFPSIFQKCSIFTPDIRKQPHISLESV